MKLKLSIKYLLSDLWSHIDPVRRKQFVFLLVMMVLVSLLEIFSIGAVLPFINVLTSPERIFGLASAQIFIRLFGITTSAQLQFFITIAFGFTVLTTCFMRLLLLWANAKLSYAIGSDISISIYQRTLYQPYAIHCERNSSEIINGVISKSSGAITIINYCINILSAGVMLLFILIALLAITPFGVLVVFIGFAGIYIAIIYLARKKLLDYSQSMAFESTYLIKSLQEGLGGIRDILINGSQVIYCQIYEKSDRIFRRAQGNTLFISSSPRYIMETLGIIIVSIWVYLLSRESFGIVKATPIIATVVLGVQRLLPIMQQAYAAWTGILSSQTSLQDTLKLLNQPLPEYLRQLTSKPLPFNRNISLKGISFRYTSKLPYVLKEVNFNIKKGSRVGFIGPTGSGKSTLLDIIMCLLQPTDGKLEIDGQTLNSSNQRSWQMHIAHVPQNIFLVDSTIEENIAFGVQKNKINFKRVRQSAKQAQIDDYIQNLPQQYKTFVGERGIRLSGGQRQRIGIARALYNKADVIIFDEATSALDDKTEKDLIQAIEKLSKDLTILIIAHRYTTLKNCSHIFECSNKTIKRKSYNLIRKGS
ncbi:MdlB ABC-type multidrug transport system, ATPase and permease components [Candidatus Methylopumilus universalis]|uniref:ABC transporter ATP-binding protein n=1 Tax=Candidatus Methylopumilus universalis TaxID=2588536 RepID=UPI003BEED10A